MDFKDLFPRDDQLDIIDILLGSEGVYTKQRGLCIPKTQEVPALTSLPSTTGRIDVIELNSFSHRKPQSLGLLKGGKWSWD